MGDVTEHRLAGAERPDGRSLDHEGAEPATVPDDADRDAEGEAVFDDEQQDGVTVYDRGQKHPLDHGVKVRAKVKRGSGTRDQDTLLIEGRGESATEAAAGFEAALEQAEEGDWADRLRALQADTGGDA